MSAIAAEAEAEEKETATDCSRAPCNHALAPAPLTTLRIY